MFFQSGELILTHNYEQKSIIHKVSQCFIWYYILLQYPSEISHCIKLSCSFRILLAARVIKELSMGIDTNQSIYYYNY